MSQRISTPKSNQFSPKEQALSRQPCLWDSHLKLKEENERLVAQNEKKLKVEGAIRRCVLTIQNSQLKEKDSIIRRAHISKIVHKEMLRVLARYSANKGNRSALDYFAGGRLSV